MGDLLTRMVILGTLMAGLTCCGASEAQEQPPADKPEPRPTALVYPISIAVAPQQGIFVADLNGHCVWQIKEQKLS